MGSGEEGQAFGLASWVFQLGLCKLAWQKTIYKGERKAELNMCGAHMNRGSSGELIHNLKKIKTNKKKTVNVKRKDFKSPRVTNVGMCVGETNGGGEGLFQ